MAESSLTSTSEDVNEERPQSARFGCWLKQFTLAVAVVATVRQRHRAERTWIPPPLGPPDVDYVTGSADGSTLCASDLHGVTKRSTHVIYTE
jgi:hypothetical protein